MKITWNKIKWRIAKATIGRSAIGMWKMRAKQYGPRAALNIGHTDDEIAAVTQMQRETIFPFLKKELTGREQTLLDYGCGPGRFTADLAKFVKDKAIGVDPIGDFLKMAPKHEKVEYRLIRGDVIPVADKSVDIVWICLVLGGILDKQTLEKIASEIERILKDGGLIALIENTTDAHDGKYWKFRPVDFYQSLFGFAKLQHVSDYYDLGERISIMTGRSHV